VFDVKAARERFPALTRREHGRQVLYFDNPAGTQLPRQAIDGFVGHLTRGTANVGGDFATSRETDRTIAEARACMADFLGADDPDEIVFGPNMTSLTFQVSHAFARRIKPGDEIVCSRLDHDGNVAPWLALRERGAVIRWTDLNPGDGTLDMESAERAVSDRTVLVAVGYASNALGTINDVRTLTELAHAHDALAYVDAVHYGPHGPIDVQEIGCDMLVCSAYKFFGPHLAILWGKREVLADLPAFHVRPAGDVPPGKWETGTQSFESLSALLGTIEYLSSLGMDSRSSLHVVGRSGPHTRREILHRAMDRIRTYERTLAERLVPGLVAILGVTVYGITDPGRFDSRVPTVSFTVRGRDPFTVGRELGRRGIFSWAGTHYAVEPMERLGLEATNRVGLVHYNLQAEIEIFLAAIEEIA
jgi:cysteine desulfurase family protein (TIGR01976 family)